MDKLEIINIKEVKIDKTTMPPNKKDYAAFIGPIIKEILPPLSISDIMLGLDHGEVIEVEGKK